MAVNTITRSRLRRLADVHPQRGRVLSVFLNLDPSEFATPAARSTAVTSVMTKAAHRVDEADGLDHEERVALRQDVERVRERLTSYDIAENGTRAVAVYACGEVDLLEVVRLRRPVDFEVVLDRSPYLEPLVADADEEQWAVLLANRRSARLFLGDGGGLADRGLAAQVAASREPVGIIAAWHVGGDIGGRRFAVDQLVLDHGHLDQHGLYWLGLRRAGGAGVLVAGGQQGAGDGEAEEGLAHGGAPLWGKAQPATPRIIERG